MKAASLTAYGAGSLHCVPPGLILWRHEPPLVLQQSVTVIASPHESRSGTAGFRKKDPDIFKKRCNRSVEFELKALAPFNIDVHPESPDALISAIVSSDRGPRYEANAESAYYILHAKECSAQKEYQSRPTLR